MIKPISTWLIRIATWRTVIISLIVTAAAIQILTRTALLEVITATGGLEPFDLQ